MHLFLSICLWSFFFFFIKLYVKNTASNEKSLLKQPSAKANREFPRYSYYATHSWVYIQMQHDCFCFCLTQKFSRHYINKLCLHVILPTSEWSVGFLTENYFLQMQLASIFLIVFNFCWFYLGNTLFLQHLLSVLILGWWIFVYIPSTKYSVQIICLSLYSQKWIQ